MTYLQLMGGLLMLYLGAEWLIGGSSRLALLLRIPKLIVGLTIVAYGTSTPEAVVSVQAALAGHGDLALGNVVGSNIANIGLILGLASLMLPSKVSGELRRRELPLLLASSLVLAFFLNNGVVGRAEGALLLAGALAYTGWVLAGARHQGMLADATGEAEGQADASAVAGAPQHGGAWRSILVAAVGLGVLLLGGQLFVDAAKALALQWGWSERLVGLTIVAVGTSLPELVTSVIAALRGHSDIAVGNVVGSNIFNVLFVLGAAGAARPMAVDPAAMRPDLLVLVGFTLAALFLLRSERMLQRREGAALLSAYGLYMAWLVMA
jgi:cation:H+ antiporter